MSDKNHKHKFNNDKETLKLLKAMFDDQHKGLPEACRDAHVLLDARVVEKALDETHEAAKALVAARADANLSADEKKDALKDMIHEAKELSEALEHLAPELGKNPFAKAAIAFKEGIEAFVVESKMNPLPSDYDAHLVIFRDKIGQADREASLMMDHKKIDKLEDRLDDAKDAVEVVIGLRSAAPATAADVLLAAYNHANHELGEVREIAAEMLSQVSNDPRDVFFKFLTQVNDSPVPLMADFASFQAGGVPVAAAVLDGHLSALLPVLKSEHSVAHKYVDALDFKELLGQCGHDLVKDIASCDHHG